MYGLLNVGFHASSEGRFKYFDASAYVQQVTIEWKMGTELDPPTPNLDPRHTVRQTPKDHAEPNTTHYTLCVTVCVERKRYRGSSVVDHAN